MGPLVYLSFQFFQHGRADWDWQDGALAHYGWVPEPNMRPAQMDEDITPALQALGLPTNRLEWAYVHIGHDRPFRMFGLLYLLAKPTNERPAREPEWPAGCKSAAIPYNTAFVG